jgi:RNA polymerase sigma-70 factor (ECF subfamily)
MDGEHSEEKIVECAQSGDREAFGHLYQHYYQSIYRYVFYRVNHRQDAEDLTEKIFLKAWEHLPRYRGDASFKSWIYRIAHTIVIDHYRTRKRPLSLNEAASLVDGRLDLEPALMVQERNEQLKAILSRLSPLDQHVLTLRFINGLSTEETAQILERTVGSVRVLQHRALKAAHTLWAAQEITND